MFCEFNEQLLYPSLLKSAIIGEERLELTYNANNPAAPSSTRFLDHLSAVPSTAICSPAGKSLARIIPKLCDGDDDARQI
jgi:hypothetical protein